MNQEVGIESREQILLAAAKLFARQGYNGTSFAAVAKLANHSKALVQYHFQNKERLWQETVKYTWQQRDHILPHYVEANHFTEYDQKQQRHYMRLLAKNLVQFTIDNPEWIQILHQEAAAPGPRLDWIVNEVATPDIKQGQIVIGYLQSVGQLPDMDPLMLFCIFATALTSYADIATLMSKSLGLDLHSDEFVEKYTDSFVSLLQGNFDLVKKGDLVKNGDLVEKGVSQVEAKR